MMFRKFTILAAGTGKEALQLYKKHQPDIVILGLILPDMEGIEVMKRILKRNSKAIVLILTALSDINVPEILAAGAKEVFFKPIRKKTLCKTITKELGL